MLRDEDKKALSKLRMENAEECLRDAAMLLQTGSYKSSANRSYYAVFHAMRSVLALDGIDRRHHSGIISEFRRLYIKTGIFSAEYSKIIEDQLIFRTGSDYNDYFVISREDAAAQTVSARRFLDAIEAYLKNKISV